MNGRADGGRVTAEPDPRDYKLSGAKEDSEIFFFSVQLLEQSIDNILGGNQVS